MSKPVDQYAQKDKQLFAEVQRLKDGNFDSYQNIYELSKNYIYKVIYDIVQDHHTTEDMMQETYLQVYNKIDSLREAQAFYVWAGRIASNLTLRYLQKYRREVLVEASDDDGEDFIFDKMVNDNEAFIPESVLENEEQQRIIAGILESLSPEQKLTVQYFYYEEMSVNDIAAQMECSTGTVKSRLNYARKSLKTAVSQFETDNDVKLYSLSSLPIFFLVFKHLSEVLALAGQAAGTAAVAGGTMVDSATVVGGTIGDSAAAVRGDAATAGGTAGGSGAMAGFLGTVAGKVAVAAAVVVVVGGAIAVAITHSSNKETANVEEVATGTENTQSSGNDTSNAENNVVEQEFHVPWSVIAGMDRADEHFEDESGSVRDESNYYDTAGNLVCYIIYEYDTREIWGQSWLLEASTKFYYADGTPWEITEYNHTLYEEYPQYGWHQVDICTSTTVQYYPDGTIYGSYSKVAAMMDNGSWTDLSESYYNSDGSIKSSWVADEFVETVNGNWVCLKKTTYNADGSIKYYETYERDERGITTSTNRYNSDGTLRN